MFKFKQLVCKLNSPICLLEIVVTKLKDHRENVTQ
jgi:hypothetical protein